MDMAVTEHQADVRPCLDTFNAICAVMKNNTAKVTREGVQEFSRPVTEVIDPKEPGYSAIVVHQAPNGSLKLGLRENYRLRGLQTEWIARVEGNILCSDLAARNVARHLIDIAKTLEVT